MKYSSQCKDSASLHILFSRCFYPHTCEDSSIFLYITFVFFLQILFSFFFLKHFLILRAPSTVLFISLLHPKFYLLPQLLLREFHISSHLCSLGLYMLQLVTKPNLSHLQFLMIYSVFHVESQYEGWLFLSKQF